MQIHTPKYASADLEHALTVVNEIASEFDMDNLEVLRGLDMARNVLECAVLWAQTREAM